MWTDEQLTCDHKWCEQDAVVPYFSDGTWYVQGYQCMVCRAQRTHPQKFNIKIGEENVKPN